MLVPTADGPQLLTPQAELRRIARSSEPLTAALALTWLARQNDPADLPLIVELAQRSESIPWLAVRPKEETRLLDASDWGSVRSPLIRMAPELPPTALELGTTGCQKMWWDRGSLGAAALAAGSHITGRAFDTPGEMRAWLAAHPDPRDTVDYWRAHIDQAEQAFARDPFLYLRLRLEDDQFLRLRGRYADVPPEAHVWRHSVDEIVIALHGRGRAFVDVLDEKGATRPPWDLLEFAIDHYDALHLGDLAPAWRSTWEHMMSGSDPELLLDLVAILASRSNNDPTIIERTVERSMGQGLTYDRLLQAHLQLWPDQHAAWYARLPSVEARRAFMRALLPTTSVPSAAVRSVLKRIVIGASEQGLMEVLEDVLQLVEIVDPTWRPPGSGVHLDRLVSDASRTSRPPKRPAPELRQTMDAMRARMGTW